VRYQRICQPEGFMTMTTDSPTSEETT
jgi:hypothetical protein